MKLKWNVILIFNILIWSWNIYQFKTVIRPIFERSKYNDVAVVSNIVLPEPIDLGIQYEYCVLPTVNIDPVVQSEAGTPVPFEPVSISTEVPVEQPIADVQATAIPPTVPFEPVSISTEVPVEQPIATATSQPTKNSAYSDLKVVNVGGFRESNFHIVLVGIGFDSDESNVLKMQEIIDSLVKNFVGINVDFAYVDTSINLDFKHIQQKVVFDKESDRKALFNAVKKVYPVDGLVMEINTPLFLGTSYSNVAMLTANDPNSIFITIHEIGHQLGLDDGYQAFYEEKSRMPNAELFYLDEMPERLITALNKLAEAPQIYKVGTCKGRSVYSFYESQNNVMRDYAPSTTNSWGASTFTPVQVILMNDYIAWYKEVYK